MIGLQRKNDERPMDTVMLTRTFLKIEEDLCFLH